MVVKENIHQGNCGSLGKMCYEGLIVFGPVWGYFVESLNK